MLGRQKRTDRKELAKKDGELNHALEAAKKPIARFKRDIRGSSQSTRWETAEVKPSSGSRESPEASGSLELESFAHKKGK